MALPLLFLWHLAVCLAAGSPHSVDLAASYDEAVDNGTYGFNPFNDYETEPEVTSPKINWLQWEPSCDDGLSIFVTPRGWGLQKPGPTILDWKGDLVWFEHFANEFGGQAYDFMVQQYQGEDYLTFWTGDDRVRGHGAGSYLMLNASYDVVHEVNAANGLAADLHEFLITPQNTALITIYEPHPFDVSNFRTFDPTDDPNDADANWIWDCLFQEIDIARNELIFEWRASDYIPLNDTYHHIWQTGNREYPFDWFHLNSIQKDAAGNYLLSARYTHSLTYISGLTGEVIWTLGGKGNVFADLSDGYALNFAWQHDARFVDVNAFPESYAPPEKRTGVETRLLSLFDNAAEDQNYEYGLEYSRGLLLEVTYPTPSSDHGDAASWTDLRDTSASRTQASREGLDEQDLDLNQRKITEINGTNPAYTVRVIQSYISPEHIRSSSQGSMQLLPQGAGRDAKVIVGFGLNAVWTEFAADGTVLCNAHFGATTSWERGDIQSYRAFKFAWTGKPRTSPKIDISDDDYVVYTSWNGATEIEAWVLQASKDSKESSEWIEVARLPKDDFEMVFELADFDIESLRYVRTLALDINGEVLPNGVSQILDRGYIASFFRGVNEHMSQKVSDAPYTKIFWGVVAVVSGGFLAYEGYRRYLGWNGAVGALRWRKNGYRLLGDM